MSAKYLTNLPDVLFYKIMSYSADTPLNIAFLLLVTIAPLCSSINDYVQGDSIWELILREHCRVIGTCSSLSSSSRTLSSSSSRTRRRSKRLRRTTAKEDVMHAFTLRRANVSNASLPQAHCPHSHSYIFSSSHEKPKNLLPYPTSP